MTRLHRFAPLLSLGLLLGCPAAEPEPEPEPTPAPPTYCEALELPERAFQTDGDFGSTRWKLANDFTIELIDRTEWTLSEQWTGCDSYTFIPDSFALSQLDNSPLWENDGVLGIIEQSARNVHYFFISTEASNSLAGPALETMAERIEEDLEELDEEDAAWWREHLHVVRGRAGAREDWIPGAMNAGRDGFTIDRFQRVREIGSLADVERFSSALQNAGAWPWENNLSSIAFENRYYNYEATRQDYLDAQTDVTIVKAFSGEVLGLQAFAEVDFPTGAALEAFDTLEIDLQMWCPDQVDQETSNCGAWDYLSHIYMRPAGTEEGGWVEVARFITTYHRAGRYLVDATPLLSQFPEGTVEVRYDISPSWNPQAYLTEMDFRFSNQGKGMRPSGATTRLWDGKGFNSAYNDDREDITATIPATAQKVEIWALITGHGGATNNCAEFCNHQHEWTIGSDVFFHEHDTIGNDTFCRDAVDQGVVPNQSGTWWFGRGGWCPGQEVQPVVFDVTDSVTPGSDATISYRGLFNNGAIPDDSGNIRMTSWLVVYE
ncbi:MAG: hypothetical protein KDA24_01475 [Deltaproteobacteria bacterium]|nr:hypothetical protein [Deltaproteobacteria bacterium]